jgi:hypothetical protein
MDNERQQRLQAHVAQRTQGVTGVRDTPEYRAAGNGAARTGCLSATNRVPIH